MEDEEYRKKMYDYAIKIGFIIENNEEYKKQRIQTLVNEGWRAVPNGDDVNFVNIKAGVVCRGRIVNELKSLYNWLISA